MNINIYVCPLCYMDCFGTGAFWNHLYMIHGIDVSTPRQNPAAFPSLSDHTLSQNFPQGIYSCRAEGCSSRFYSQNRRARHEQRKHPGLMIESQSAQYRRGNNMNNNGPRSSSPTTSHGYRQSPAHSPRSSLLQNEGQIEHEFPRSNRHTPLQSPRRTPRQSPRRTPRQSPRRTSRLSPEELLLRSPRNSMRQTPSHSSRRSPIERRNMHAQSLPRRSPQRSLSNSPRGSANEPLLPPCLSENFSDDMEIQPRLPSPSFFLEWQTESNRRNKR